MGRRYVAAGIHAQQAAEWEASWGAGWEDFIWGELENKLRSEGVDDSRMRRRRVRGVDGEGLRIYAVLEETWQ